MKRNRIPFSMSSTKDSIDPLDSIQKSKTSRQSIPSSNITTTTIQPNPQIQLTTLENDLFKLLLDVVATEDETHCTLRVAGGWVRDKLLFPNEDMGTKVDIDIALDKLLGNQFAEKVNAYLCHKGQSSATVAVIQKNPDQSKHLETARMRLLGVWLDFVNLRTETYSHDSRIPNVDIGTPREDALRRDLTINALFYNIASGVIEDFTGFGLADIKARLVRTPLPPLTTLLDDPLRALRAVRFAARLNFAISSELVTACCDSRVHTALSEKVSRERISTELDRSFTDSNPPHALALLVELGLFSIVFRLPSQEEIKVIEGADVLTPPTEEELPSMALSALLNLHTLPELESCPASIRMRRYAATLSPLATGQCLYSAAGRKKKLVPLVYYIMRAELRLGTKEVMDVCLMHTTAIKLMALVHKGAEKLDRLEIGSVLMEAGPYWRSALQIALVMELPNPIPAKSYTDGYKETKMGRMDERRVLIKTYEDFQKRVENMGLDGVWDVKPVIDGKQLMILLPELQKGPVIGKIMKEQVEWMIQNPGSDVGQVEGWLKTKYAQFTSTKT